MVAQRGSTMTGWIRSARDHARHVAEREERAYQPGEGRSLAPYAGAIAAYGGSVGLVAAAGALSGASLPGTVSPWDVTLLGVATHKLSRLIAKDTVTAPIRAPFTRLNGPQAPGELSEEVRGSGRRHVIGELLTCPFCLAQWVATGFAMGLVFAPRATRLAAATFTAVAISDVLQNVYAISQQLADRPTESGAERGNVRSAGG
jgi:hypothetical protein